MILRSIRVQGWRCLHDPVEVGPLADGVNVIHAPNATGKSTLFEALLRGMLDGHRVKSQELELIRPWGRDLAPTVTVEFSQGGIDYQLAKRFLDNPFSEFKRKEGGRFVRLAEGEEADQRVRELWSRTAPGKGLALWKHWGIAQVLWAPQGSNLALPSLSGDLVTDIQRMLGAQVSGPSSSPVEGKVEEWYLSYYTPKGRFRIGKDAPMVGNLEAQLREAISRKQAQQQHQEQFEELARQVEDLRARQAETSRTAQDYERKLADKRPQAERYARLLSELTRRQEQVNSAQAQYDALKRRLEAVDHHREQIEAARKEHKRLTDDLELRDRGVAQRKQEAEQATTALENARKDRPKVKQAQDEFELGRRYLEARARERHLQDSLAKLQKLLSTLEALKIERSRITAPDDKTLRAIRKAITARDQARVRLEAALITVQVVALRDGALEVVEGEDPGTKVLASGYPMEVKGSPQVVVDLPQVGRIRAWGPAGSIKELRDSVEMHLKEVNELTREFRTTDIAELDQLRAEAAAADKKVAQADTQIGTILSGQAFEDIEKEHRKELAMVSDVLQQRPNWENSPPDLGKLEANAEAVRQGFVEKVEATELTHDSAERSLATARELRAGTEASLRGAEKLFRSLKDTLEGLEKDGKTDAERQEELAELALRWDAANAGLQQVKQEIDTFQTDPRMDVEGLEKLRQAAETGAKKALADEKLAEGKLEQSAAQGTYSALAETEEKVNSLQEELADEKLSVKAAGLLHELLMQCRQDALAQVSGPVERAASALLRRIAGSRLGTIRLGEAFEPSHVLPEAAGETVGIENASGGEKEQVYLATRLALAEVLARRERQLVVLDDVLTATDSGRLARVLRVLEEAAQRVQIIVLTCHPERYGALDQAKFFDLESLVKG